MVLYQQYGKHTMIMHCVHKKTAPEHVLKCSKLASFAQLQFNSMNIRIFSIKFANFSENRTYSHRNIGI